MTYTVDLTDPNAPKSRVEVLYTNPTEGSVVCKQGGDERSESTVLYMPPSCYWTFWRILGSEGTTMSFVSSPGFDDSVFLDGFAWS